MVIEPWLAYVAIPPITACVAWLTNWVGIKMLFFPVRFVGFWGIIGWQGIIPRLRVRLTRTLVGFSVAKIATPAEVLRALDESEVVNDLAALLTPQINDWVDEIIDEHGVKLWQVAPQGIRNKVYEKVRENVPDLARAILKELEGRANSYLDIEQLAVDQVKDKPEFLNELFLECAGKEMDFVIRSGIYFGAPLGVIQALAWYFLPLPWVLPVFGVLAGAFTNWIALQLIAHPANPVKVGPFTVQGLYLKRQHEVSQLFGETFCKNFLNSKVLVESLWEGPHADEVHRMVRRHVRGAIDEHMLAKFIAWASLKDGGGGLIADKSVKMAFGGIMRTVGSAEVNAQLTQPISDLIGSRMRALPPREFQQLLLPAFNEDQVLVVLVGGILGGFLGFMQLVLLFGGG
ncbi:DUF445 domain-containing protein [Zhongshania arctica]|uniref:DUF445 domain-containing protein n=1 Tax=Zhongshania arctica TaxID=3238302 RepID=A0ABV3U124_9GAMM